MEDKKSIIYYTEWNELLSELEPEEQGECLRFFAGLIKLDDIENPYIKSICKFILKKTADNAEKYQERCDKNKANAKKRWEKHNKNKTADEPKLQKKQITQKQALKKYEELSEVIHLISQDRKFFIYQGFVWDIDNNKPYEVTDDFKHALGGGYLAGQAEDYYHDEMWNFIEKRLAQDGVCDFDGKQYHVKHGALYLDEQIEGDTDPASYRVDDKEARLLLGKMYFMSKEK